MTVTPRYSSGCRQADSSAFVNFGSVPMTVTPRYSSGCRQADSSAFVNFGSVPMTVTPRYSSGCRRRIHRLSSTSVLCR
ncbi:hypothetical protein OCL43_04120 [Neisseria gonorrhoeae]|uniref:hypothetical protein n=1 Tax=Neisseria gonorrhoeae TaxID=485 RepID=UPI0021D7B31C|nr:hypothetical protein [Neisseria gonorrhoeae]UXY68246.1 hypothetical protein OCL43_04120 [Neisseria gonorrhoeae]